MRRAAVVVVAAFLVGTAAQGGVFLFAPLSESNASLPSFLITHPPGFDGSGGTIEVRVCIRSGSEQLSPSLHDAMAIWNSLSPLAPNCSGCFLIENPGPPTGFYDARSTILHELGHCAMGLDHTNLVDTSTVGSTSFTNSTEESSFSNGDDGIRGTFDDRPFPLPGTRVIHWFRKLDNNPVVIDGTTIDESTFSRTLSDLPIGHIWPASANVGSAPTLGAADTQAVMYSVADREQRYLGLTADEVNTVRFGMTGLDETAGTADDYTAQLQFEADCVQADIEVFLGVLPMGVLASCENAEPVAIPDPPKQLQHFAIGRIIPDVRIQIILNDTTPWRFQVFADGFESGDTSGWPVVCPPNCG